MYRHPKEAKLEEIIKKYSSILAPKEIWEILLAGQIIYAQGNGLSYITVLDKLGLKHEDFIS